MIQKTIWMRYLIFGISSMTLLATTCGKKTVEPPIKSATYVYINKLNTKLFIEAYGQGNFNSRSIESGDSIKFLSQNEAVFPFMYSSNVPGGIADSVIIKFSDGHCVRYKNYGTSESEQQLSGGLFNLKEYDNYSPDLVNQRSYTLRYSIDSTDYKKAKPCK